MLQKTTRSLCLRASRKGLCYRTATVIRRDAHTYESSKHPGARFHPETIALGLGYDSKSTTFKSVKSPLYLSSTFLFDSAEVGKEAFQEVYNLNGKQATHQTPMIYSRVTNPNILLYEQRLAAWDQMTHCLLFSSGMAAVSTLAFSVLKPGDHCFVSRPVYGGTDALFSHILPEFGVHTHWIEAGDNFVSGLRSYIDRNAIEKEKIKLIYIETPSNPSIVHTDIAATHAFIEQELCPPDTAVQAGQQQAAHKQCYLAVDNTLLGPKFQTPAKFGADAVLHSATKFLGGHSDLIAGTISCNDEHLFQQLSLYRTICGGISQPFVSWLLLRSLETLSVRMERQCENAKQCAEFLATHKKVRKVYYSTQLPENSHQSQIYQQQCVDAGSLISFDVDGDESEAFKVLNGLEIFALAVSLGGTESLCEHPYTMTHADVDRSVLQKMGVTASTVRLSIGIEHIDDLLRDLKQALDAIV